MRENFNSRVVADNFDLSIPEFMQTREYEIKRQKRIEQRRIEEKFQKNYRVQRNNIGTSVKKSIRRKKIPAVRIIICGVMITIIGLTAITTIVNNRNIPNIEIIQIEDAFESQNTLDGYIESNNDFYTDKEVIYNFDYDFRLNNIPDNAVFSVGSALTEYVLNKIENSESLYYYKKYGEMYGIDPFILIAKGIQEASLNHNSCIPGGSNYNGYGVGICQLESPDGREIVAHNYLTNEDDIIYLTMNNAIDLETNIKMGAMLFQNCLERCNGNLYLAIQSYNYSPGMMNIVLNKYATQIGSTVDAVKSNLTDTGWLNIVQDVHNNPTNYVNSWEHSTYGDENYIENVLRYFVGDKTYFYFGETKYVLDFNNNELIEIDNVNSKII